MSVELGIGQLMPKQKSLQSEVLGFYKKKDRKLVTFNIPSLSHLNTPQLLKQKMQKKKNNAMCNRIWP